MTLSFGKLTSHDDTPQEVLVDRNSYAEQMHELGAAAAEAKRRGLGVVKLNHEDLTPGSKITIL